jgi:hypothetical protein
MLLPPVSARKAVRLGCAKTLSSMSHMYTSLMSVWITNTPTSKELQSGQSPRASSFRNNLAAVALQLRNLKDMARLARWEGNVRGHWPYAEYDRLVDAQLEMTSVLAQVSRVFVWELRTLVDFPEKACKCARGARRRMANRFLASHQSPQPELRSYLFDKLPLCKANQ